MLPGIKKIVIKSVRFYKKPVVYQILIVALLSAVITGSLLTGSSVRNSLKKSASEHLGNTGILISSGNRYFNRSIVTELKETTGLNCAGLLEIQGFCQNLTTQEELSNIHIYAVADDFFSFQGKDSIKINSGEAAVNEKIASSLGLKSGDDLIISFKELSEIPGDAPFAPGKEVGRSIVLKTGAVLTANESGNFSLSINQTVPGNIFVNISEIARNKDSHQKINRLLIQNKNGINTDDVYKILSKLLKPTDIGISLIHITKTGGIELRSERIFIESQLIDEIKKSIPSAAPVITYLGNRFSHGSASAPYSFISGLPQSVYHDIPDRDGIIINKWLADDLSATTGDSIAISWYTPDSLNKLIEKNARFCIKRIVEMSGIWGDSLLMPAFPGISGSESCSDWDAGVPVKLNEIRKKDEAYWNQYRGTPKAFINYEKGIELWGNNFGPATAVRFSDDITEPEIYNKLSGHLDPAKNGFVITNIFEESVRAASESVDFSTLFLSLGFFLILASFVLLSFAVSTYLDSKYNQIRTYFALGFRTTFIEKLFLTESGLISIMGCLAGSVAGYLVSLLIIRLLNTVWQGAVQTDALSAFFSVTPILTGFLTTTFIVFIFIAVKIKKHLRSLNRERKVQHTYRSRRLNLVFLGILLFITVLLFVLSFFLKNQEIMLCFVSGSVFLVFMIVLWRQYIISPSAITPVKSNSTGKLSGLYFAYYPAHAITPVLFIAAGIFAVFITGANRMSFDSSHQKPSGGTGGFTLWCESSIPVRSDLTTISGKAAEGLDDEQLSGIQIMQLKKFAGNDASCLNLNHVTVPPLLGADAGQFISRGSFSFAKAVKMPGIDNPWQLLNLPPSKNTIYGVADQTVLEWGLGIKSGDTLIMRSESGQRLNIRIAGGLKSSVFQGYVLIGMENFRKYFPSVSGSNVMLIHGDNNLTDVYAGILNERLAGYGISVERTNNRLAAFYEVTNTYLSVFGVFGALGMITGIAGLGFVLLRNYNSRKREFALMMATGFKIKKIRNLIFSEQMLILAAGVLSGVLPAILATYPSLKNNQDVPWIFLLSTVGLIFLTGTIVLLLSLSSIRDNSLIASLRKE
jgi:putative ABC transport system permease protein